MADTLSDIFDLDTFAKAADLGRKTVAVLRREELTTLRSLSLLSDNDIRLLGLPMGQSKLLGAAVRSMNEQATPQLQPQGEEENTSATTSDAGEDCEPLLNACKQSYQVSYLDPLHILTIKANRSKAVHITAFLPDAVKKRISSHRAAVQLKRQDQCDAPYILAPVEDEAYTGITIAEWGAANCRVMHHLLDKCILKKDNVSYYLAYTTKVFDLASKYAWNSVLEFDRQYREVQAEHGFQWGTWAGQLEVQVLVPRPSRPAAELTSAATTKVVDCRQFKMRGQCSFGANCKYRHVAQGGVKSASTTSTAQTGAQASKND